MLDNSIFDFYDGDVNELVVYDVDCPNCDHKTVSIMPLEEDCGKGYECSECGLKWDLGDNKIVKKIKRSTSLHSMWFTDLELGILEDALEHYYKYTEENKDDLVGAVDMYIDTLKCLKSRVVGTVNKTLHD